VLGKNVGKLALQLGQHPRLAVHGHVLLLPEIKGPDVVEPRRVVLVLVGEKQRVEVRNAGAQHLLPEVRARVDDEAAARHGHVHRHAQPVVAVVERAAHRAGAPYHRHPRGRARAEESNGHCV